MFASKLVTMRAEVESQLRDEFQREIEALRQLVDLERSQVSRQKADLNVKSRHLRDLKSALIKQNEAKEEAYIEAVESLRNVINYKDAEIDELKDQFNRFTFEGERSSSPGDEEEIERLSAGLRIPNHMDDTNHEITLQKQLELDYKINQRKAPSPNHTRKITPHFSNQLEAQPEEQPSNTARFLHADLSRKTATTLEDSFEIRPSNDCQIYAEARIEREMKALKKRSIDLKSSVDRVNFSDQELERARETNLLTYSSSRRPTREVDQVASQTSLSKRESKDFMVQKTSKTSTNPMLSEADPAFYEVDEVDFALKCKGMLDLILLEQPLDDQRSIEMKQKRTKAIKNSFRHEILIPRVQGIIKLLCSKFESHSSILQEQNKYFVRLLKMIDMMATELHMSSEEKIQMYRDLDTPDDIHFCITIARGFLDQLKKARDRFKPLIELYNLRLKLRVQLEFLSQEFESLHKIGDFNRASSSIYTLLRNNNKEIITCYHKCPSKIGLNIPGFKGTEIMELITLDFWEEEYLRKLEGRLLATKARFK